ncbi:IS3 family transposase [Xanthocytophaga flava]|uniref:IS3 family transposase n=1 Tax=Xanthocytophaga flava TaxID=3048013 RepID=UPI0028D7BDD7|nr:IS3 family transposase [Xanthocytophaga flavus]MDJ1470237.1 IS3 family transposase [Xanthocytophaga flavus]
MHLIKLLEAEFPVDMLCELLQVSRAAYYRHRKRLTFQTEQVEQTPVEQQVKQVFVDHKRRYGTRRIQAELKAQGIHIGRWKIRKYLKKEGLQAIQPKSFVPKTTDSAHGKRNSPNLLLDLDGNRIFQVQAINKVWVGDLTYLPVCDGSFLYLNIWIDLFSRNIVGWQLQESMEESLVIDSLKKAILNRRPEPGLIVHSDRGSQYASNNFRKLLTKHKCRQSMSRKDNCYDNAIAESLFSRLKTELLEGGVFLSLEDAKTECFEYIEIYYNRNRKHSALNYLSPVEFEEKYNSTIVSLASDLSH